MDNMAIGRYRLVESPEHLWAARIIVWCIAASILLIGISLIHGCDRAWAGEVNIPKLADAIYLAEGGAKTFHPYGILAHYKHTTPRQACINTINSNLKRWDGNGDFITFLGKTYCPIGAANDPTGLNKNWIKNVRYFYERGA